MKILNAYAQTITNTAVHRNPSTKNTPDQSGRILQKESVHFISRIEEIIGEESVSSFARRSGVIEGTIRNVISGALPRTDNLVSLADAGGVLVDWLATGRGPKTRAELKALQDAALSASASPKPLAETAEKDEKKAAILAAFNQGNEEEKETLLSVARAILEPKPTKLSTWFQVGMKLGSLIGKLEIASKTKNTDQQITQKTPKK